MLSEKVQYKFYKYSLLTFLMFISAINYNLLVNPSKIVSGGTNGISILIEEVFKVSPSITILLINAGILIVAFALSEYKIAISSAYASIIYPLFVELTSNIRTVIGVYNNDYIAISIFAGLLSGIVTGFVCRLNMSQGGTTAISQLIGKRFKISISRINIFMNIIVVLFGGFVFGLNNIFYALIFLVANKISMDRVMLGTSQKKLMQIITTKEKEVRKYITEVLNVGYTTLSARGGYNNDKKTIIITSVNNMNYFKLKEGIHEIDKNAFIVVTDSYQVNGGK